MIHSHLTKLNGQQFLVFWLSKTIYMCWMVMTQQKTTIKSKSLQLKKQQPLGHCWRQPSDPFLSSFRVNCCCIPIVLHVYKSRRRSLQFVSLGVQGHCCNTLAKLKLKVDYVKPLNLEREKRGRHLTHRAHKLDSQFYNLT